MDICLERADLLSFCLCCFTLCHLDFLFLSRMMSGEGSGIRPYRFLNIAFSSTSHIKKMCKWTSFTYLSIYIENETISDKYTTELTGCFVLWTHSRCIWSFYSLHEKDKMDRARNGKYGLLFTTKNTKHPAHVHAIDSRCNVTVVTHSA